MINNSIFQYLAQMFGRIYALGDSIILYQNGNVSVSLNNFIIALAILGIILTALLNFVRVRSGSIVNSVKSLRRRQDNEE